MQRKDKKAESILEGQDGQKLGASKGLQSSRTSFHSCNSKVRKLLLPLPLKP